MAVGVRDELDRKCVDARVIFECTFRQFGQFAVIAARQVLANFANLFFDDMKIIDEPFRGGRNDVFAPKRLGQRLVGFD